MGRHAAAVLASLGAGGRSSCRLLSLYDPFGRHEVRVGKGAFEVEGFGGAKAAFMRAVSQSGWRTGLVYIGHPNLAPAGLALRLAGLRCRYVVAVYGIDIWARLPLRRRLGLRFADAVLAITEFTARRVIQKHGIDGDRVLVVPPALDDEFLEVANHEDGKPVTGGRLLTVARLTASDRYKGVDCIIRALRSVLSVLPQTTYVVVGEGNDRPRLEALARGVGVSHRIRFVGSKSDAELPGYYRSCDIFLMPSRAEGFGIAFLEAMAFGKVVIGGNHGGTPHLIENGITGFLVEHGDLRSLAALVVSLLGDPALRDRVGREGRERVRENYTFSHYRDRLTRSLYAVAGNGKHEHPPFGRATCGQDAPRNSG